MLLLLFVFVGALCTLSSLGVYVKLLVRSQLFLSLGTVHNVLCSAIFCKTFGPEMLIGCKDAGPVVVRPMEG
jgi:hypothetical protein